jgi:hypothetical protein
MMPRRDSSGPTGQGPLTGRALGNCRTQSSTTTEYRRGNGRGLGRSFKNVSIFSNVPSLENEKKDLEERLREINSQLDK